jgi:hypothetical protein
MKADKQQIGNPDLQAECYQGSFEFQARGRRKVVWRLYTERPPYHGFVVQMASFA